MVVKSYGKILSLTGMVSIQVGKCQLLKYVRDKPPAVRVHMVLPEEKVGLCSAWEHD